ncbi:MAG: translocase, partial [Sphingobium sp.]|nr:translocase [Sphingobium sp.]
KWADQNKRIMAEHPPESAAPAMEALDAPAAAEEHPPYVAQSAVPAPVEVPPFVAQSAPVDAAPAAAPDGPPYVAEAAVVPKGDAAA